MSKFLESARAIEAARVAMQQPSFIGQLFAGEPDFALLRPFPEQPPADRAVGDQFCARVERFLRERVDPLRIEREAKIPPHLYDEAAELGLFGMTIPPEYGGLGLSQTNYDRVLTLVASYCNIFALVLSVHQSIGVARPIMLFGTPEQKREWLPRLARGELSAFALTEPQIGSDPANMATTARLEGDAYVIDGEKLWCTNGPIAKVIILAAKVEGKITAFIVEMDRPGVELRHRCEFMGCRGIENGWVRFSGVRIPPENVLGEVGRGLRIALTLLNVGRVSVAAICLGMAKQMLEPTISWANQRQAFGKPIGQHELNTHKIARMAADVFAMEAVTELVAGMIDRGRADFRMEAATAKLFCSERLWSVVDTALQLRGGRGYERADSLAARGEEPFPVEQVFRDARLYLIGEGASEILKLFIAREALDPHIGRAAALLEADLVGKVREVGKLARFYTQWYARRLLPEGRKEHPDEPPHLRYVRATSRRLARAVFRQMARYNLSLERRQAIVARLASVAVELFVIAAAASRAEAKPDAAPLADQAIRDARARIDECFRGLARNDDPQTTQLGLDVLKGEHGWLADGSVRRDGDGVSADDHARTATV
ncbi:MAG TPA: acyl-CoA dehydrogenase family protein [Chloroflexota bacterium]|nr:acyl-CoA dehydrogenase family protein [Chloroflexota bacterium]